MKAKYLIFFLLLGCKKIDKSKLTDERFIDLVGTWTTDYPNDEERKIIITKNGKVEIHKATERGEKFSVREIKYGFTKFIVGNDTLPVTALSGYHNGKSDGFVMVFKKFHSDTAYFGSGLFIKDFEVDTNVTTDKVIYIRN